MAFSIEHGRALAPLTTLELGGPASHFVEVADADQLAAALEYAARRDLEVFVLGGGSNVVFPDDGWPGLVIRIAIGGVHAGEDGDVTAGAGVPWAPFVTQMVALGYAGVECLAGIPGSVGATPIQNVGAYGQEVSEVVTDVLVFDRERELVIPMDASECDFGYRDSRFKRAPGRFVVLSVRFQLRPGGEPTVRYAELQKKLADIPSPELSDVYDAVLALRKKKSMVIDPSDPNRRSAGSFFLNPIVDDAEADRILDGFEGAPRYPAGEGRAKLSAAWLIDNAGMKKGYTKGAVGISSNHTLALVHHGGGTTKALLELADEVRATVRERFGVDLVPEPTIV